MSGYTVENLLNSSRSLMVVHGAALGILVSQVGPAVEHPILFDFLTAPLLFCCIGFVLALLAYQVAAFDPPPDVWWTHFVAWLPVWTSGFMVILAMGNGISGYLKVMFAVAFPEVSAS